MNLKRVLTALIGFPIVVLVLIFSNKYIFDMIITIIAFIAMYEYLKAAKTKYKVVSWISYLSILLIPLLHIIPSNIILFGLPFALISLLLILFLHVIATDMKITFEDIAFTLIGIIYVVGLIAFMPLLYGYEGNILGKVLFGYVLTNTWGCDTFAYIIGKRIGKTKFSKVSPNKSIEGCIVGTIAAILFSLMYTFILNYFFIFSINYIVIGAISLILSLIGQIGDFSASIIKRYFEIKDFSEIFPGHGGMIDRIDSVMSVAPFAYLLLTLFI